MNLIPLLTIMNIVRFYRKKILDAMTYLLLGVAALAVTCQDIFKKQFNARAKGGVFFFGGMISLCAMLFFIAVNRDWAWNTALLFPAAAFALSYATCTVFTVLAIRHGSLAKTTLIVSCSLLVPSFYGILFLKEPVSATLIVGLVLLVVGLVLINRETDRENAKPVSKKWVLFVLLSFLGNGMCSTVQKAEQLRFGDAGKNLFMILALAMVTVMLLALSFLLREERALWRRTLLVGWPWALLCGCANGLTNMLTLYLNPLLPASVMYPVISAGGIVLCFLYATLVEKERFDWRQRLGFLIGVVSIVLLNL